MVFNAMIRVYLLLTFIIRRVIANDNERQFQQTIARKKKIRYNFFEIGFKLQLFANYRKNGGTLCKSQCTV